MKLFCDDSFEGEGSPDDIMDLDGQSPDGKTLNLEYDIADQSWSGEDSGSFSSGYEVHDGKRDRGDDGLTDENDGQIKYIIYTDGEISPIKRKNLSNTYSPVMYFHEDESYYPRDVEEFLGDSEMIRQYDDKIYHPTKDDLANNPEDYNYLNWFGGGDSGGEEYNIYSHVFTGTGNKIVIQYWFFYLNNPGINTHEGDWEMIQIILDENENLLETGHPYHYSKK